MNKRLMDFLSDSDIPAADLKISAEAVKSRVRAAIIAELLERKHYMKYRILKTALIAACIVLICTAAAFAASPAGQEAIGSIIDYFQNGRAREITSIEELSKYNTEIGQSVTKDGKTLTLDNIAADDNYIHVFYTLKSDIPFYEEGSEPMGLNEIFAAAYKDMWVDCHINGEDDFDYLTGAAMDGYFVDSHTFKCVYKYNAAAKNMPDVCKIELFADRQKSGGSDVFNAISVEKRGLTDEEKASIWYVSAEVNMSDVKVKTITKEVNEYIPWADAGVKKIVISPFGNQLLLKAGINGDDEKSAAVITENLELYDENNNRLDKVHVGFNAEHDVTYEFTNADINTKQIKIVSDADSGFDNAVIVDLQ